ncbi:TetR/AcrR family transcriptional regulator C-terminal domain-containing protein [Methylobacterium planeticum]|uniref:TetR/AcrR family transcriptional regulator C-terminal domain-containing protein n=1 Tax=Methylobacterium planeticum TaxID=2615211 RepID=UPI0024849FE6|nr:TetR/AcrR family transcriptional regulator C-terminal domain-containing protein [Methylobacterium planeticum]
MLREGGIAEHRLVEAADMLVLHTTAVAAEEANRAAAGQDSDRVKRALAAVSGDRFPVVAALVRQGMFAGDDHDDDARMRRSLDVILDGITANQSC